MSSNLVELAREEPTSVTDEQLAELIEQAAEEYDTAAREALQVVANAEPNRAGTMADELAVHIETALDPGPALTTTVELASLYGERMGAAAPALVDRLDDGGDTTTRAAQALAQIGPAAGDALTGQTERIRALLTDEAMMRWVAGTELARSVAESNPAVVVDLLDELFAVLERESDSTLDTVDTTSELVDDEGLGFERVEETLEEERDRQSTLRSAKARAAEAIAAAAPADSEPLLGHLDRMVLLVESLEHPSARYGIVDALAPVAEQYPREAMAALDALVGRLDAGGLPENLGRVARVLGFLADADEQRVAEAVRPNLDAVLELLAADNEGVNGAAVGLLMYVAEQYPDEVAEGTDALLDLLDARDDSVRGSAAWVLGTVGEDAARERLVAVSEEDRSEEVRQAAAHAADRIAARTAE
jgi:hypothetical protein